MPGTACLPLPPPRRFVRFAEWHPLFNPRPTSKGRVDCMITPHAAGENPSLNQCVSPWIWQATRLFIPTSAIKLHTTTPSHENESLNVWLFSKICG